MITRYGFMPGQLVVLSSELLEMMDGTEGYIAKANELLLEEFQNCENILIQHKELVQNLADAAIEKNHLLQDQIRDILEKAV